MYKQSQMVYLKALTPVHAGTGQGIETVDMPIQRERHSNIPKIEASSLKGSVKHSTYQEVKAVDDKPDRLKKWETVFGPEDGNEYASAIGFTDARLLLFPIKSTKHIYRLITCPYILKRWAEDMNIGDSYVGSDEILNEPENNDKTSSKITISELTIDEGEFWSFEKEEKEIILEEYVFNGTDRTDIGDIISELEDLKKFDEKRIVILSDTDFIDLVTMYTEIVTRNKINPETGTVIRGGLFTEEYLPTESILYFTALASPSYNKENLLNAEEVMEFFKSNLKEVFHVGGNATIGKGFVKTI